MRYEMSETENFKLFCRIFFLGSEKLFKALTRSKVATWKKIVNKKNNVILNLFMQLL